jgi:hypothetical protein
VSAATPKTYYTICDYPFLLKLGLGNLKQTRWPNHNGSCSDHEQHAFYTALHVHLCSVIHFRHCRGSSHDGVSGLRVRSFLVLPLLAGTFEMGTTAPFILFTKDGLFDARGTLDATIASWRQQGYNILQQEVCEACDDWVEFRIGRIGQACTAAQLTTMVNMVLPSLTPTWFYVIAQYGDGAWPFSIDSQPMSSECMHA